jgi:hypothetical protein
VPLKDAYFWFNYRDFSEISWGKHGAEFVVESIGIFTDIPKASAHAEGKISWCIFCKESVFVLPLALVMYTDSAFEAAFESFWQLLFLDFMDRSVSSYKLLKVMISLIMPK